MPSHSLHCCPSSPQGHSVSEAAAFLRAIADHNRMRVICFLQKGGNNVTAIAQALAIPQNLASHHLKILRSAGILRAERRGQEIYYGIDQREINRHLKVLKTVLHPKGVPPFIPTIPNKGRKKE